MSISQSEKNTLMQNYSRLNRAASYLKNEMSKHEKYLQERRCFRKIMGTIYDIQIWAFEGLNFLSNLPVQNEEISEEESYIEETDETDETEEESSEDVVFLSSNKENNGNNNR